MAIPYIQLGRVELDPMGVPVAASMRQDQEGRFEQLLRDSVASEQNDVEAQVPEPAEQAPVDEPVDADLQEVDADPVTEDAATEQPPEDGADVDADQAPLDEQADVTDSLRRGEAEQPNKGAGKGADSPRTSTSPSEPLIAAAFHAQHGTQPTLVANAAAQQQPGPTTASQGEPLIRGAGTAQQAGGNAPKAQRAQTGYATKSAQSMQLLEQARDSVFKQILMKLTNDGGEMRMRLSPPDLGQLDLRMTVEGGNKLTLLIGAERSDMAQLLQRHIEELKGTLQENGLEVTGAEVQTRDDFERQQNASDADSGATTDAQDDFAEDAATAPRNRGYITAEGLDFWA